MEDAEEETGNTKTPDISRMGPETNSTAPDIDEEGDSPINSTPSTKPDTIDKGTTTLKEGWKPTDIPDVDEDTTELGLGYSAADIPIPLRGLWDYFYKHVPDKPTPAPSQTLRWNAEGNTDSSAGTNVKDKTYGDETSIKVIGKDTQEEQYALDEITGKMKDRREKMKVEEEKRANELWKELEDIVRRQREGYDKEGKRI